MDRKRPFGSIVVFAMALPCAALLVTLPLVLVVSARGIAIVARRAPAFVTQSRSEVGSGPGQRQIASTPAGIYELPSYERFALGPVLLTGGDDVAAQWRELGFEGDAPAIEADQSMWLIPHNAAAHCLQVDSAELYVDDATSKLWTWTIEAKDWCLDPSDDDREVWPESVVALIVDNGDVVTGTASWQVTRGGPVTRVWVDPTVTLTQPLIDPSADRLIVSFGGIARPGSVEGVDLGATTFGPSSTDIWTPLGSRVCTSWPADAASNPDWDWQVAATASVPGDTTRFDEIGVRANRSPLSYGGVGIASSVEDIRAVFGERLNYEPGASFAVVTSADRALTFVLDDNATIEAMTLGSLELADATIGCPP